MLRVILVAVLVLGVLMVLRAAARPPRGVDRDGTADDGTATAAGAPAPRPLSRTAARHTEALAAAREDLQHAEAAHTRAVRTAQERFIGAGLDLPVMTLAGWRLGRLTLTVADRQHWLTTSSRATVDVVGEVRWRSVLDEENRPRIAPVDDRQVRLRVQDTGWAYEASLPGDQHEQAQRFVAATESTVATLTQAGTDRQRRIEVALAELDAARADTEERDRARMTVEDLEGAGPLRRDLPPAPEGDDDEHGRPEADRP